MSDQDVFDTNRLWLSAEDERSAAMQTEAFVSERRSRVDREAFWRILNRAGGEAPRADDVIEVVEL